MAQRENFGTVLVGEGLVTLEQLQQAREIQAESGEALTRVLVEEKMIENSRELGEYFLEKLGSISSDAIAEIRGRGLWIAGRWMSFAIADTRSAFMASTIVTRHRLHRLLSEAPGLKALES